MRFLGVLVATLLLPGLLLAQEIGPDTQAALDRLKVERAQRAKAEDEERTRKNEETYQFMRKRYGDEQALRWKTEQDEYRERLKAALAKEAAEQEAKTVASRAADSGFELAHVLVAKQNPLYFASRELCGLKSQREGVIAEVAEERSAARISGYVNKQVLYEAGHSMRQLNDEIAALGAAIKRELKQAPLACKAVQFDLAACCGREVSGGFVAGQRVWEYVETLLQGDSLNDAESKFRSKTNAASASAAEQWAADVVASRRAKGIPQESASRAAASALVETTDGGT